MATTITFAPTGAPFVDGLLRGLKWSGPVITISVPQFAAQYESPYFNNFTAGFSPISTQQIYALNAIIFGLQFSPNVISATALGNFIGAVVGVGGANGFDGSGDIRFAQTTAITQASTIVLNSLPDRSGGDIWFPTGEYTSPVAGTLQYVTHIHEIGHAFGLKHPHDPVGAFQLLPSAVDAMEWTVMSYRDHVGDDIDGYATDEGNFPQTFMQYDIFALQTMYGAWYGQGSNNTDTVYAWNPNTGQMFVNGVGQGTPIINKIFLTIWDGGGVDTYDMSNYSSGVQISLAPGEWSITSFAQMAALESGQFARGTVYNAFLFNGDLRSIIENARGGAGGDFISGNQVANFLAGNGGNDTLVGLGGNDILDGGPGADTMRGGPGNDTYIIDSEADVPIENANEGIDTIVMPFAAATLSAQSNFENLTGNPLANTLTGNARANVLRGLGGNDILDGGAGADTLDGGDGDDRLLVDTVETSVIGGAGVDTVVLVTPGMTFSVGAGASIERIVGTTGKETIGIAGLAISVAGGGGADTLTSTISRSLASFVSIENLKLLGAAAANGTGTTSANTITGNSGKNTLNGLAGNDTLIGGSGNDTLIGGSGKDVLVGGAGRDIMTGGASADRFDFDVVAHIGKTSTTRDRITDFSTSGGDVIDLSTIDANGSAAGNAKFKFLSHRGDAFTGVKGQVHWYHSGSKTIVEGDINGDKRADFQIELTGHKALTAGDFIL